MFIQHLGKTLKLDIPQVMGILNTTPDSFSDGGSYTSLEKALGHAEDMISAGATMIDIGGESTRPGAPDVSLQDELARVIPVIKALRARSDVWISVDTSKPTVMEQAIEAGADMINDIRALQEPGALAIVAKRQVPVCIMHMKGQPRTMQQAPQYDDVMQDVLNFLQQRIDICMAAGIQREHIIIDPGFGFGKSIEHNYHLLANLKQFQRFNLPILAGMSRKSMIHKVYARKPKECVVGSVACATIAAMNGANIIRVHDVQETVDAMKITNMTLNNN